MTHFLFAFNAVFPLLAVMATGYLIRSSGLVNRQHMAALNRIVFYLLLPAMLFSNVVEADLHASRFLTEAIFSLGCILVIFLTAWIIVRRLPVPVNQKGVLIQAAYRSNFVLLGVPLTAHLVSGRQTGLASSLAAIVIPTYAVLSVICLSAYADADIHIGRTIKRIVKNPLIWGSVLGIIVNLLALPLPEVIPRTTGLIGRAATPLALLCLGGQIDFSMTRGYVKPLIGAVFVKLILVPVIFLPLAILLGFRGESLAVFMILFGSPVAITSYTMAQELNGNSELAGQILALSSVGCTFTFFIFIAIFKALQLL